ncbi:general secretion pathway protein GspC [Hahella sp. CCB-MM4]|uniref:type II secretion system protein N n=1 Tax=Hahella sp. (strain CCB-MM4) TaxID=1926491 RepID=UPI000B9C2134|nr:type II secretion system protein N [Hahella sp. CCB-MM4]OZG74026.1 general secretion pathway protein GspC [Hahella sp. CCB-MM4]
MQSSTIAKLAWWILVVLIATVAWQSAKLTWLIWEGAPNAVVLASGGTAKSSTGGTSAPGNYLSWNLFGKAEAKQEQVSLKQVEAPETKLRLDLYGVVVGVEGKQSGAIIAERGRNAEYYRIDEELPGNAKLAAVYHDHILLSRAGALEKLTFEEGATIAAANIEEVSRPDPSGAVGSPEEFMNVAQQRLAEDPRAALASVGLSPNSSGEGPSGYVFNGNNPMLGAMSMQKGDVIRSVNGHVLGNIEEDRQKLQELYESGMLEVEIERDGAVFTINYPLR